MYFSRYFSSMKLPSDIRLEFIYETRSEVEKTRWKYEGKATFIAKKWEIIKNNSPNLTWIHNEITFVDTWWEKFLQYFLSTSQFYFHEDRKALEKKKFVLKTRLIDFSLLKVIGKLCGRFTGMFSQKWQVTSQQNRLENVSTCEFSWRWFAFIILRILRLQG